jgi:GTPase SAR1 family protein
MRLTLFFPLTAGQERFRTITNSYYRSSHAALLVYDTTDLSTFRSLDAWLEDICRFASPEVEVLLCANKADDPNREVSPEVGRGWAEANGMGYIETSALHSHNVDKAFDVLLRAAVNTATARAASSSTAALQASAQDVSMETGCVQTRGGCC